MNQIILSCQSPSYLSIPHTCPHSCPHTCPSLILVLILIHILILSPSYLFRCNCNGPKLPPVLSTVDCNVFQMYWSGTHVQCLDSWQLVLFSVLHYYPLKWSSAVQYMSADDLSLQYCPHVTARNCTALEIHCTAQHTNTLYISQKYTAQFTEIHCAIHRNTLHITKIHNTAMHCCHRLEDINTFQTAGYCHFHHHNQNDNFHITIKMIIFTL